MKEDEIELLTTLRPLGPLGPLIQCSSTIQSANTVVIFPNRLSGKVILVYHHFLTIAL